MPPPERFGRYEVIREIGRGGMAVVYLARDPRVGREVAIKVISADLAGDAEFRRRFDREAQALARLEHSAIVPLYDHGDEDGTPYLVFRYMEGGSLAQRIGKQGALPLEDVAAIARRVGAALDYAHGQGVIHRDIKPANILFDRNGEAWLGDFGISLAAERTSSLTSGAWIGSPAYMSPEQADGNPATAASDIYSLGCTLFEAVTGRPPFAAEKPVALLLKHLQEPAPRASSVGRNVPDEVDRALLRAMAKDPGERTPTGGKLAESLGERATSAPVAGAVRPPEAQGHGSVMPTIASAVDTGPLSADATRAVPEGASPVPTVAEPEVGAPRGRSWRPRWMLAGLAGIGLAGVVAASVFALAGDNDGSTEPVTKSAETTGTSTRTLTAIATRSPSGVPTTGTASPTLERAVGSTPTSHPTPVPPTATAIAASIPSGVPTERPKDSNLENNHALSLVPSAGGVTVDWTLGRDGFALDPPAWLEASFTLSEITPPLTDGSSEFSVHDVSSDYFGNIGPFNDAGHHTTVLPVTCDDVWKMVDESRMGDRSAELGRIARSLAVAIFVGLSVRGPGGSEGYAGSELALFRCQR